MQQQTEDERETRTMDAKPYSPRNAFTKERCHLHEEQEIEAVHADRSADLGSSAELRAAPSGGIDAVVAFPRL
jgi:hypothetical protein